MPIKIGEAELSVEIASSFREKERGLSNRDNLNQDRGLLFIFDKEDFYYIWMKDMKFPIDIVWIDGWGRVIEIKSAVAPSTYPKSFTSQKPAYYVLEVNAGWATENDIKIGDKMERIPPKFGWEE